MTYENAMQWYQFDSFSQVSREHATVGALWAASEVHDISVQPRSYRLISPLNKLEGYRSRAAKAAASSQ